MTNQQNTKNNFIAPQDLSQIVSMYHDLFSETHSLDNMETVFYVNKHDIDIINEDLYYRNNLDGKPEDTDEIIVNIDGYKFKYILQEEI